jgi:hypothetical protein
MFNTTYPNAGFTPEGEGYSLDMLSTTYAPVYYGFNCRPRQIKYRPIEESCLKILSGKASLSVAKAFYEKLKPIYDKTCQQIEKLKQDAQVVEDKRNACKDYATRQLLIKERNRIENRIYGELESKKDTLGHYVEKIGELIKTHDHPLTENPPSVTL